MSSPITDPAALVASIEAMIQTGEPQVFLYGVSGGDDNPVLAIYPEIVPSAALMGLFLGDGGDDVVSGTVWHDPDTQQLWFSGEGAEQSSLGEALSTVFAAIHPALSNAGVSEPEAEADSPSEAVSAEVSPEPPPERASTPVEPPAAEPPRAQPAEPSRIGPSRVGPLAAALERHLAEGGAAWLYCPFGPDGAPYLELRAAGSSWSIAEIWVLAQRCGDPQVAWGEVVRDGGGVVVFGEGPAYRSLQEDAGGDLNLPALAQARFEGPKRRSPTEPAPSAAPLTAPSAAPLTTPSAAPLTPPAVVLSRPAPVSPEAVNTKILADTLAKMQAAAEQLRAGRYHRLADDVMGLVPVLARAAPAAPSEAAPSETRETLPNPATVAPAELSKRVARILEGVKKLRLNGRSRSLAELAGEPFPDVALCEHLLSVRARGPGRLNDPAVAPIVEQLRGVLAATAESASQLHSWWEQRSLMTAAQVAVVGANLDALYELVRAAQRVLAVAAGVPVVEASGER